jgi:phosphate transport system ATP-binding protein
MASKAPKPDLATLPRKAEARALDFFYGAKQALKNINLPVYDRRVTALIGPSGCGKSTFLRCFNRMHDLYPGNRYAGEIRFFPDDLNLLGPDVDPIEVRMRLAMVFQKPNPFPKSIFENVAYGLRIRGVNQRSVLLDKVEEALTGAALWNEVKDRLDDQANNLSGGQQQRLCIARALASEPGARPDRHRQHRGTGPPVEGQGDHPHRHPQHAAGGARVRFHRLHVPWRPDRVRLDG